jgi:FMN phosphatase YigB (HAD superfamily)
LSALSLDAADCLMVGNDLEADIKPAVQAGLQAFHISKDQNTNEYQTGTLQDLIRLI